MKILNCHIENFGKLQNYSIDFTDKENIICRENGWGKSTLAAFIRAMFYGLEGERKRSVEENEPKRYRPWQGGVFGGRLTFEVDGRQYIITRNFANANDFELRDARTNMLCDDYSHRIGEELFKVNRESFMRTVFIGQNDCETSSTDDINAKIGNLVDNINDINSYEAANVRLTKILNELTPGRITGSLAQRRDRIASLERIVNDGSDIEESIKSYQEKLNNESGIYEKIKSEIDATSEQQKKVSEMQTVIAKRQEWEKLQASYKEKEEALSVVKKRFPGEVPDKSEVDINLNICSKIEDASRKISSLFMTEDDKKTLSELQGIFGNEMPKDKLIDEMIVKTQKLNKLRQQLMSNRMTEEEINMFQELDKIFANDNENVSSIVAKWNNRNTKKATLPSNQAAFAALKATMSASNKKPKS